MAKTFATFELADGTVHTDVRITLQDKLQHERTARAKNWDIEKEAFRTTAFWAWHAGKREGLHNLSWEEFEQTAVDAAVYSPEEDDEEPGSAEGLAQS